MSGETDLQTLLSQLDPVLDDVPYAFTTSPDGPDLSLEPVAIVHEAEGWTLVIPQTVAQRRGLATTFPCRRVTLTVHSSLAAVGMMAAVSRTLADAGISCNPVAGFHHDHLFVPEADAGRAIRAIRKLSGAC